MLIDGIYVLINGKYIGPEKPGPWALLFESLNIDVFSLGPLFILFGLSWITWLYALWSKKPWMYKFGLGISIATLWYLPVGTLISIILLTILFFNRDKLSAKNR